MSIPKKNLPPKIAPRTPGGSPKYASRDVLLTRADRMRAERDKAVAELARLREAVVAMARHVRKRSFNNPSLATVHPDDLRAVLRARDWTPDSRQNGLDHEGWALHTESGFGGYAHLPTRPTVEGFRIAVVLTAEQVAKATPGDVSAAEILAEVFAQRDRRLPTPEPKILPRKGRPPKPRPEDAEDEDAEDEDAEDEDAEDEDAEDEDHARWLRDQGLDPTPVDLARRGRVKIRLYLDDMRPCPVGYHVARSVREAIELMRAWTVVTMSLDHDLGACATCIRTDPQAAATLHCEHVPNGQAFVRWMIATGCWPREMPVVHSANPSGREAMRALIRAHWRSP